MLPNIRIPGKRDRRKLPGLALHCRLLTPDLRLAPRAPVHPVVCHALVRSLRLLVEDLPGCGGARGVFGSRRSRRNLTWLGIAHVNRREDEVGWSRESRSATTRWSMATGRDDEWGFMREEKEGTSKEDNSLLRFLRYSPLWSSAPN